MEVPSLFQLYCSFYSICFNYGDGLKMERGGNCLILDGHWLEVPSLFQMYKNCSLFNTILLSGRCRDGEGWKLFYPGGKLAVVTILTATVTKNCLHNSSVKRIV